MNETLYDESFMETSEERLSCPMCNAVFFAIDGIMGSLGHKEYNRCPYCHTIFYADTDDSIGDSKCK